MVFRLSAGAASRSIPGDMQFLSMTAHRAAMVCEDARGIRYYTQAGDILYRRVLCLYHISDGIIAIKASQT